MSAFGPGTQRTHLECKVSAGCVLPILERLS